MKNILLLGAGQSASTLIEYLLTLCDKKSWKLSIGDVNEELANKKGKGKARGFAFNVTNEEQLIEEVGKVDLVISMLPARFHMTVAHACLELSKHLVTASYVMMR